MNFGSALWMFYAFEMVFVITKPSFLICKVVLNVVLTAQGCYKDRISSHIFSG